MKKEKSKLQFIFQFAKTSAVASGGILLLAQGIKQGSALIIGTWTAKVLTQEEYGAFRLLWTLVSYLNFANLGIPQYVLFKLPVAIGQEDEDNMTAIPSMFHSFLFLSRAVLFFCAVFLMLYGLPLNRMPLRWEWLLMGMIVVISGWRMLFDMMFRSYQEFRLLGIIRISDSIVYLGAIALLMPLLKIEGILIATILAGVIPLAIGISKNKGYLKFKIDINGWLRCIKFGFPITINSFVWILITSSTIWVVSACYSPAHTGIYGFAMVIATVYKVLPGILGEMTGPRVLSYFGKVKDNKVKMDEVILQGSLTWACINVVFAVFSLFAIDVLIRYFLPKYNTAWPIMLFMVLGYYSYNIAATAGNAAIHKGKAPLFLIINSIILLFQIGFAIIIAKYSTSFSLIGLAPMAGLMISSLSVLYIAFFDDTKPFKVSKYFWKILFNMVIGMIVIAGSWFLIGFSREWYWLIVAAFLILAICSPQTIIGYNHLKNFWQTTA